MRAAAVPLMGNPSAMLNGVLAYENQELVARLQSKLDLSHEEATTLFGDVKRYLYLCAVSGEQLAPTPRIDAGWHEFLMYTRDYASFCHRNFGAFIHHTPTPTLRPHAALSTQRTIALARDEFGQLSLNWLPEVANGDCCPDHDCHGDGSCGGDV